VDPFRATVDAAIFLVQNRPRIESEDVEFFQGRYVGSHDELSEMSDRPLAGKERWIPEAEFTVSPPQKNDEESDGQPLPIPCFKDQALGGTEGQTEKRQGIWRYRVDPIVWRSALKHAIFEPSKRNAALYNRFMVPLVKLVGEWWDRIEDSRKFKQNRSQIESYLSELRPGDLSILGLLCDGGQGIATANNGRFLGYLEGTPQAEEVLARRHELETAWSQNSAVARIYSRLKTEGLTFPEIADVLREKFDTKADLGFRKTDIYRIVPSEEIADVEKLSAGERSSGIGHKKRYWVPFRKGDPESVSKKSGRRVGRVCLPLSR
jgi:hypothetical protein